MQKPRAGQPARGHRDIATPPLAGFFYLSHCPLQQHPLNAACARGIQEVLLPALS